MPAESGCEHLQAGDTDLVVEHEFRQAVRDTIELLVAAISQRERWNLAGERRQPTYSMVGQIAGVQIAFHQFHARLGGT